MWGGCSRGFGAVGRKSRGEKRLSERGGVAHAAGLARAERAQPGAAPPLEPERGSDDGASDGIVSVHGADRDAEERVAVDEVHRSVERIAVPGEAARGAALLFRDDRDARRCTGEALADQGFAP